MNNVKVLDRGRIAMEEVKVSVILPVYNAGRYLVKCLDSLVEQTFDDMEIICVDDGSTDETPNILNRYAGVYEKISVIWQNNAGGRRTKSRTAFCKRRLFAILRF